MSSQREVDTHDTAFAGNLVREKTPRGDIIETLKNCRLFSELTELQIQRVAGVFEFMEYTAGDVIFQQGELGDRISIINKGMVHLERNVNLGDRKATVTVSALGPCRLIGCWSCLLGKPNYHTESAVCHTPTRVITARGADLREIFETDPHITNCLLTALCFMLGDKARNIYGAMESL